MIGLERTGNMKKILKTLSLMIMLSVMLSSLTSCGQKTVTTGEVGVVKNEDYGDALIDISYEEFCDDGFNLGDSVNIYVDNGKEYHDVPCFSGYYTPLGKLLVYATPDYPRVLITYNYGPTTWDDLELNESSKITITLNEAGKYKERQELCEISYSDERADYGSDSIFANFREVKGGNIKASCFYRSASPCDNSHNRAPYANNLAEANNIRFAMNLSDNEEEYLSYEKEEGFASYYYDSLFQSGDVFTADLQDRKSVV